MKTLAAIVICGLAGLATLFAYATNVWLPPLVPLAIGVAGIFIPMLVGMFFLEPQTRRAPWNLAAVSVLAALCLGVMFPMTWYSPKIRALAVRKIADKASRVQALDDRDPAVQLTACQALFDSKMGSIELAGLLAQRPTVAIACLNDRHVTPGSVTMRVISTWFDELTHQSDASCTLADAIDALPTLDAQERGLGYLECAVSAKSGAARQCCSGRVQPIADRLPQWIEAQRRELEQRGLTSSLLLISHGETNAMKEQNQASKVALQTDGVRIATLRNACQGLLLGDSTPSIQSAIRWVFGEHEACLSEEERTVDLNVPAACRVVTAQSGGDAEKQICIANQLSRRETLAEIAEYESRPKQNFEDLAGEIAAGSQMRANERSFERFIDAAQRNDPDALSTFSRSDLQNMRTDIQRHQTQAPMKASVIGSARDAQERTETLRKNKLVSGLLEAKSDAEIEAIHKQFETRARNAGKGIDEE